MHSFRDAEGRQWHVSIDVNSVKRIRETCDFDPLKLDDAAAWERFGSDPVLVVDAIYAALKPDCDSRGVSDEAFGRALVGDPIEQATEAFLEALADFFPSPAKREVLKRAIRRARQETERGTRQVMASIDSGEMDRLMDRAVESLTSGAASTNSPESSASIPDRAPSGS